MPELTLKATVYDGPNDDLENSLEILAGIKMEGQKSKLLHMTVDLDAVGEDLHHEIDYIRDMILKRSVDAKRLRALRGLSCPYNAGLAATDCMICFESEWPKVDNPPHFVKTEESPRQ